MHACRLYYENVYRIGSSQRLPRIMRAWERIRNFIILKECAGLRIKIVTLYGCYCI